MNFPGSADPNPARSFTLAPGWIRSTGIALALALIAVLVPAASALAATFPVSNTENDGAGSLEAAIQGANGSPGPDRIEITATGTIELANPLPVVTERVDIVGPGREALTIRRAAATPFRILEFTFPPQNEGTASVSDLTVANGRAPEGGAILDIVEGGGILSNIETLTLTRVGVVNNQAISNQQPLQASAFGGGIHCTGALILKESLVTGNQAIAGGGTNETQAFGGGVDVAGSVQIESSTIAANSVTATSTTGLVTAAGGGASVGSGGGQTGRVERSTISDNAIHANGGSSPVAVGGGLLGAGTLTISDSTLTANSSTAPLQAIGANLSADPATVIRDSIVSAPRGGPGSCDKPFVSQGFNIEDGSSCGFSQTSDRSNTDPGLDPALTDNGGPTPTHALLAGSIAIDHGNAFGATADQRGMPRPSDFASVANAAGGDGSDIGAFEAQAPAVTRPPDTAAPNTRIGHGPGHQTGKRLASFRFSSTEAGSRFECRIDKGAFRRCTAPFKHKVKPGARHIFMVRAIDAAGNVDRTPAKYVWRVKRPSLAPHRAR
jgi:hypothetical protein